MNPCDCTPTTSPCSPTSAPCTYGGSNLDCIGILNGESYDSAISKLSESICNLTASGTQQAFYSERAFGTGTPTTTLSSLSGASYTIPIGGDGDYEISYIGEYVAPVAGTLSLRLYKNSSEYSTVVRRTVTTNTTNSTIPFTLTASSITLVAGDVLVVKGSSTATTFIQNVVCKISKIS